MKKAFNAMDKTNIVLEAFKDMLTNSQISSKYPVHPIQIGRWKKAALRILKDGFSVTLKRGKDELESRVEELQRLLGIDEVYTSTHSLTPGELGMNYR